jgi:cytochrome oxidase Cu insertion factor (SCO1/SenC/PrrC family)
MSNSKKQWLMPLLVMASGIAAVVAIAIVAARRAGSPGAALGSPAEATLANYANQDVDPGSPAGDTPAPNFVLRDQMGRETSLAQFRGKVVLIAFVDSQCTTICPLTTESMVEALRLLGPAAADVQLIGINANPLALKVSDVAAYTRAHDMQGQWQFLTGSLPQLKKVWRDYNVYVAAVHNDIDHQPAMVLIDTVGREHKIYMTQMSYEGVAPQAQVLANDIAKLLPGPPTAAQEVSLKYVEPLQPSAAVSMRPVGAPAPNVQIGGAHAHLLLFFASWLDQDSNVKAELATVDQYAAAARRKSWPSPVAIDELPTESSSASAKEVLTSLSAGLHTPIVEDADGRLGDGYQVEDLPWYSLSSPSGEIIWSHDGWLTPAALEQQVGAALAKDSAGSHTASFVKPRSAAGSRDKISVAH